MHLRGFTDDLTWFNCVNEKKMGKEHHLASLVVAVTMTPMLP